MRDAYEKKLNEVKHEILSLSQSCLDYFKEVTSHQELTIRYSDLFALSEHIQKKCMELLLLQAPVASDLRFVGNSLKMAMDLDRIASHTREYAINLGELDLEIVDKQDTIDTVIKMFHVFMNHYEHNTNGHEEMNALEIKMDELYEQKISVLKTTLIVEEVMLVKYLERMADHLLNLTSF